MNADQIATDQSTGLKLRIVIALTGTLGAAIVWVVLQALSDRFGWPTGVAGVGAFGAAWIALYPIARMNRSVPAWAHWAQGAFVLLVLWMSLWLYRG